VDQIESATPEEWAKLMADNRGPLTQLSLMVDGLRHNGLLSDRSSPDDLPEDSRVSARFRTERSLARRGDVGSRLGGERRPYCRELPVRIIRSPLRGNSASALRFRAQTGAVCQEKAL